MELNISIGAAVGLLILAVVCGWLGARPYDPMKGPRMIPYRAIMLLSATIVIVLLVHIAGLTGLAPA